MSKYTLDIALVDESKIISNLDNLIYQLNKLLKPVMREVDGIVSLEILPVKLVDEIASQTNRLKYLVYCTSDILDRLMIEHKEDDVKLGGVDVETPPTKSSDALETIDGALTYQKHTIDILFTEVLKLEDRLKMLLLPPEDKGDVSELVARVMDSYVDIVEDNTQRLRLIDSVLASIIERLLLSNMDEIEDTKR